MKNILDFCLFILLALAMVWMPSKSNAYEQFDNWEGVFWKPGTTINIDFYDYPCANDEKSDIEQGINYFVKWANYQDSTRQFNYVGRRLVPGWIVRNADPDAPFTLSIDCSTSLLGNNLGQAVPFDNCPFGTLPDRTLCKNGDARYLTDASIKLLTGSLYAYRLRTTVLHELGHAAYLLNHSTNPESTMWIGFYTPFSSQFKETWARDDWCGIQSVYAGVGETIKEMPFVTPTIDDSAYLHVPQVEWLGLQWQLIMINDGTVTWTIAQSAKPVPTCNSLIQ